MHHMTVVGPALPPPWRPCICASPGRRSERTSAANALAREGTYATTEHTNVNRAPPHGCPRRYANTYVRLWPLRDVAWPPRARGSKTLPYAPCSRGRPRVSPKAPPAHLLSHAGASKFTAHTCHTSPLQMLTTCRAPITMLHAYVRMPGAGASRRTPPHKDRRAVRTRIRSRIRTYECRYERA